MARPGRKPRTITVRSTNAPGLFAAEAIARLLIELHGKGGLPSFGDTQTNPQNGPAPRLFAHRVYHE